MKSNIQFTIMKTGINLQGHKIFILQHVKSVFQMQLKAEIFPDL